jgi:hypothetical protein
MIQSFIFTVRAVIVVVVLVLFPPIYSFLIQLEWFCQWYSCLHAMDSWFSGDVSDGTVRLIVFFGGLLLLLLSLLLLRYIVVLWHALLSSYSTMGLFAKLIMAACLRLRSPLLLMLLLMLLLLLLLLLLSIDYIMYSNRCFFCYILFLLDSASPTNHAPHFSKSCNLKCCLFSTRPVSFFLIHLLDYPSPF